MRNKVCQFRVYLENKPNFAYILQIETPWEIFEEDMYQRIYITKDEAENIVKDIIKNLYCKATSAKKMELIKLLAVDSPEEE